jgi:hypothetical protein
VSTLFPPDSRTDDEKVAEGLARMDAARTAANPDWDRVDAALVAGEEHVDLAWRERALEAITALPAGREFMSQELVDAIEATGVRTHDRRALGSVVREASAAGLITKTLKFGTDRYGSNKRVWVRT